MGIVSNNHKCSWQFNLSFMEVEDQKESNLSKVLSSYMKSWFPELKEALFCGMKREIRSEITSESPKHVLDHVTSIFKRRILSIPAFTPLEQVTIEEEAFFSEKEIKEIVEIETVHNKLCLLSGLSRTMKGADKLFQKIRGLDWKKQGDLISIWLLDPETRIALRKIKFLNLKNIGFTRLPEEVKLLVNCKRIDLSYNNLIARNENICPKLKKVVF